MGVVNTTYTFSATDTITSAKMNNIIDQTTITGDAITGTTLEVTGTGKLKIRQQGITSNELATNSVTTTQIASSSSANNGVTFSKLQYVADMKVIGNVSGGLTVPSEVSILDEDNMASDSATALVTQQSIKAYVDSYFLIYNNTTIFTGAIPTTFTDLDLSSVVGSNRVIAYLLVSPDVTSSRLMFKEKGISGNIGIDPTGSPTSAAGMDTAGGAANGYIVIPTDNSGIIQWKGNVAGPGGTTVKIVAYQKMLT